MPLQTVYPTPYDREKANKFVFERQKLLTYNWWLRQYTNIFSLVHVEIHVNHDLAAHNPDCRDYAIYVRLKASRDFCAKIRCNMWYPRGRKCNAHDPLRIFKSGDSDVTACEPGCFKLFSAPSNQRPPLTMWSTRCDACLSHINELYSLGIDDYNRTVNHTTPHIDTIGTGYEIDDARPFIDPKTGDESFHFRLNKYYCENFDMSFYQTKCSMSTGEEIAGFFLGDTIYHLLKYSFVELAYGTNMYRVKEPKVTSVSAKNRAIFEQRYELWDTVDTRHAFYINPMVKLSDLGITSSGGLKHMYWTTEHDHFGGGLVEPLLFYKNMPSSQQSPPIPEHLRINRITGRRDMDEYTLCGQVPRHINVQIDDDHDGGFLDKLKTTLRIIVQVLAGLGIIVAADKTIAWFLKKQVPHICTILLEHSNVIYDKFILHTFLAHTFTRHVMSMATTTISHTLLRMSKMLSTALSVVDIVTLVFTVVDLIIGAFDPLYENNLVSQEAIDAYSHMNIRYNRAYYGHGTMEFSPIMLILMLRQQQQQSTATPHQNYRVLKIPNVVGLDHEQVELMHGDETTNFLDVMKFHMLYLKSLRVNSNGSIIQWTDKEEEDKDLLHNIKRETEQIVLPTSAVVSIQLLTTMVFGSIAILAMTTAVIKEKKIKITILFVMYLIVLLSISHQQYSYLEKIQTKIM
nr:hypothetical protein [Microctonus hyperodae filamentous virus]